MFRFSRLLAGLKSRRGRFLGAVAAVGAISTACAYNEELGRNQILLGDPAALSTAANQAWTQIRQQERISTDRRYTSRLDRVAPKVIRAVGDNPGAWEYEVFASDDLNAFALPGNKIGIYTGIMDIMENDAQLAAVVGHEIAHVRYNHAAERSAQNTLGQLGALGLGAALGQACAEGDRQCQERGLQTAALGVSVFGLLPYSRQHELEADAGGVRYMAQAGYNPCEAIDFWQNMNSASTGSSRPPEFLSTHPAGQTRIDFLRSESRKLGYTCR